MSDPNIIDADYESSNRELVPLPPAGGAIQTHTLYNTAVKPAVARSLVSVQKRFLDEADLAGEDFYYGWGAGRNKVEGASVDLAMALVRCWGNAVVEARPIQELPDSWIFPTAFVDLETGFTLVRNFRQSKNWTVHGKMDLFRKEDMIFAIGQSKSARNVVLQALPKSLVLRGIERAKLGVRTGIQSLIDNKGLAAAAEACLKAFAKEGVTEAAILSRCGVVRREGLELEHLVSLKGDLGVIQRGQERAEILFPAPPDQASGSVADKVKAKADEVATAKAALASGPQGPTLPTRATTLAPGELLPEPEYQGDS